MNKEIRAKFDPLAKEIINKIEYHLRYKMQIWPKEDDLNEIRRIVKSILITNYIKEECKDECR